MRITLDTNILVSATFWKGNSYKILELIDKKIYTCIVSQAIIEEYRKVLEYGEIIDKINKKSLRTNELTGKILINAVLVDPKEKLDVVKEDFADNKILECALEGKSQYVITNDAHLLNIKEFREIKIVTPEKFLSILNQK